MKRYTAFFVLAFAFCALMPAWAQPSFRGPREEPKREDFPTAVETSKTPVDASFSFAIFSDLHISPELPQNVEDLRRAIDEVNEQSNIAFVLVCGDVTHNGDTRSLQLAKDMLDELAVDYFVIPGNHDTRASESAATDFARIFGDTHFRLLFNGNLFLGLNTGPMLRPNDGHIAPQDVDWLAFHLKQNGRKQPVYFVAHHPLQSGDVDNWETVTDLLRQYNVQGVFCGHYHRNALLDFDGLTGVVVRSTLRGNDAVGGYTILDMGDSLYISEKRIGQPAQRWMALPVEPRIYDSSDLKLFPRPNFDINKQYKSVKSVWQKQVGQGIYGSMAVDSGRLFFGDESGMMRCFDMAKGKQLWQYKTPARIAAAPAVARGKVLFGCADGQVYCLDEKSGKLLWKRPTTQSVCAVPLVVDDVAFVGSGDGQMRAFNIDAGSELWSFAAQGYIQTDAVLIGDKVAFAAYDKHIYAVDAQFGEQVWSAELSANAVTTPILANEKLFAVTADGALVALDANNGALLWRKDDVRFIASIGISEDGTTLFARTADGEFFAFDVAINQPEIRWKKETLYAADCNPCGIAEHDGKIAFATKNGLIISLDAATGDLLWQHKTGNTGINRLVPTVDGWLLTTLDGVVERIFVK